MTLNDEFTETDAETLKAIERGDLDPLQAVIDGDLDGRVLAAAYGYDPEEVAEKFAASARKQRRREKARELKQRAEALEAALEAIECSIPGSGGVSQQGSLDSTGEKIREGEKDEALAKLLGL